MSDQCITLTAGDFEAQARAYRRLGNAEAAQAILSLAWWLNFSDADDANHRPTWAEQAPAVSLTMSYGDWTAIRFAVAAAGHGGCLHPSALDMTSHTELWARLADLASTLERRLAQATQRNIDCRPADFAMAYLRCQEAGGLSWPVVAFAQSLGVEFTEELLGKAREYLEDYPESLWPTKRPASKKPKKAA